MIAGAFARIVPAALPPLLARCPPLTMPGRRLLTPESAARGAGTWQPSYDMADGNTVAELMTTVMPVHIVSGPVNPVSVKIWLG